MRLKIALVTTTCEPLKNSRVELLVAVIIEQGRLFSSSTILFPVDTLHFPLTLGLKELVLDLLSNRAQRRQ